MVRKVNVKQRIPISLCLRVAIHFGEYDVIVKSENYMFDKYVVSELIQISLQIQKHELYVEILHIVTLPCG